jgi:hypothetical protein
MHEGSPPVAEPVVECAETVAAVVAPGAFAGRAPETGSAGDRVRAARWRGGKQLSTGHELYWWVEITIVLVFDAIYETVRNSSKSGAARAFDNAIKVIDWQKTLGIYREPEMQRWALHYEWLIVAANYFYGSAYIAVTIASLIFLYRRFPDDYPLWRNTLLVGTLLGLIGFATFPLMPPRLLDALGDHRQVFGYVDTLVKYPTFWSFDSPAMKSISNQFAAMPSLHCGWALWSCAVFWPRVKHWWAKALAVAYPIVTIVVVVITGNHYMLDAAGGAVIFLIGYGAARLATRAGRQPPRRLAAA